MSPLEPELFQARLYFFYLFLFNQIVVFFFFFEWLILLTLKTILILSWILFDLKSMVPACIQLWLTHGIN